MIKEIIEKEKKKKAITTKKPKVVKKVKTTKKVDKIKEAKKSTKYFEAVGRRKTAIARVRLFTDKIISKNKEEDFIINEKSLKIYFPTFETQETIFSPFKEVDCINRFRVSVIVKGGGVFAQAGAVRHGIAKALILFDSDFRKNLKKAGFLTRDPRMRERKKFGLKRARRAPQWSKR